MLGALTGGAIDIGSLVARITGDTTGLDRALNQTNQTMSNTEKNFSLKAAAIGASLVAIGTSMGVMVKKSLDMADAIGKSADAIGISTGALQEYRHAANLSGLSTDSFDRSLLGFNRRLGELKSGTGELYSRLKQMDGGLIDAMQSSKDTGEALAVMFKAIDSTSDASERAALSAAAFGREGMRMANMLRQGTDGLEAMRKEARDLGLVLDEKLIRQAEEANDKLYTMWQVVKVNLSAALLELAPVIAKTADSITHDLGPAIKALKDNFDKLEFVIKGFIAFGLGMVFTNIGAGALTAAEGVTSLTAAMIALKATVVGTWLAKIAGLATVGATGGLAGLAAYGAYEASNQYIASQQPYKIENLGYTPGKQSPIDFGPSIELPPGWEPSENLKKILEQQNNLPEVKLPKLTKEEIEAQERALKVVQDLVDKFTLSDYDYAVKKVDEQFAAFKKTLGDTPEVARAYALAMQAIDEQFNALNVSKINEHTQLISTWLDNIYNPDVNIKNVGYENIRDTIIKIENMNREFETQNEWVFKIGKGLQWQEKIISNLKPPIDSPLSPDYLARSSIALDDINQKYKQLKDPFRFELENLDIQKEQYQRLMIDQQKIDQWYFASRKNLIKQYLHDNELMIEDMEEMFEFLGESIEDNVSSAFDNIFIYGTKGFQKMFDAIMFDFKRLAGKMVNEQIFSKITQPIINSMMVPLTGIPQGNVYPSNFVGPIPEGATYAGMGSQIMGGLGAGAMAYGMTGSPLVGIGAGAGYLLGGPAGAFIGGVAGFGLESIFDTSKPVSFDAIIEEQSLADIRQTFGDALAQGFLDAYHSQSFEEFKTAMSSAMGSSIDSVLQTVFITMAMKPLEALFAPMFEKANLYTAQQNAIQTLGPNWENSLAWTKFAPLVNAKQEGFVQLSDITEAAPASEQINSYFSSLQPALELLIQMGHDLTEKMGLNTDAITGDFTQSLGEAFLSTLETGTFKDFEQRFKLSIFENAMQGLTQAFMMDAVNIIGQTGVSQMNEGNDLLARYMAGEEGITIQDVMKKYASGFEKVADVTGELKPVFDVMQQGSKMLADALGLNTDAIRGNTEQMRLSGIESAEEFLQRLQFGNLAPGKSMGLMIAEQNRLFGLASGDPSKFSEYARFMTDTSIPEIGGVVPDYQKYVEGIESNVRSISWFQQGVDQNTDLVDKQKQTFMPALKDIGDKVSDKLDEIGDWARKAFLPSGFKSAANPEVKSPAANPEGKFPIPVIPYN